MAHVVDSYNIFINTDRNKSQDTQGDQISLNLGHQPIVCRDDEYIRMSLSAFAMRKSWSDINDNNNKFRFIMRPEDIQTPDSNFARSQVIQVQMPAYESNSGFGVLYNAICVAISTALTQNPRWKLKYPSFAEFEGTTEYQEGVLLSKRLLIILEDQFIVDNVTTNRVPEAYLPVIQCPVSEGDSYKLLGGTRIDLSKLSLPESSNEPEGYSCDPPYYYNDTDVYITFPFHYSLRTEKLAYLRTSQVNSNIATTSFQVENRDFGKGSIEATQLMAAIPLQDEYIYYEANTDHNFFVNFTSKQATHLDFSITDSCGRRFPLMGRNQAVNGTRSFEMVVRVDKIRKDDAHPEALETPPPTKSAVARMANAPTQWLGRGVPGYGLNTPGQILGDGFKPVFEKK